MGQVLYFRRPVPAKERVRRSAGPLEMAAALWVMSGVLPFALGLTAWGAWERVWEGLLPCKKEKEKEKEN